MIALSLQQIYFVDHQMCKLLGPAMLAFGCAISLLADGLSKVPLQERKFKKAGGLDADGQAIQEDLDSLTCQIIPVCMSLCLMSLSLMSTDISDLDVVQMCLA